jgi:hypothetical protein
VKSFISDDCRSSFTITDHESLDWWIVSVGPKTYEGDLIFIELEDLMVWDGCRLIFVVTRKGTELRDWFTARGVDVGNEIDTGSVCEGSTSTFRIRPPQSVGIEARLTFPSRFGG